MSTEMAADQASAKQSATGENCRSDKDMVNRLHQKPPTSERGQFIATAAIVAFWFIAPYTWYQGWWPMTAAICLIAAHLKHLKAIAMHEASHGLLSSNRRKNEIMGTLLGTASLSPLSVYRFVHHFHHAYVGTERDVELWPFNDTRVPRLVRIFAAQCELFLGFLYTPLMLLRAAVVHGGFTSRKGRRICLEYALLVGVWGTVLAVVALNGWWVAFTISYVVPAALAGFFTTLRRYIEHMGMFGDSPLTLTRSIIARGKFDRLLSIAKMHEDNHGAHHVYPKIPYRQLPEAIEHIYDHPRYEPRQPIYSNYWHALIDMLPHLANPRVGSHWKAEAMKSHV